MTIKEILQSAQYVVDSQGRQTAVQFHMPAWGVLRQLLEDNEGIADIQQARQEDDSVFSWDQVIAEHKAQYHASNKMINKSPLDVPGIETKVFTQDILDAISESRSRRCFR